MEFLFALMFPIEYLVLILGVSFISLASLSWKLLPYSYNQLQMFLHNYPNYLKEVDKLKKVMEIMKIYSRVQYPYAGAGFSLGFSNSSILDIVVINPNYYIYLLGFCSIVVICFYIFMIVGAFNLINYHRRPRCQRNLLNN